MDQETWNTLFGWLTGQQCFIPEGCNPPLIGIIFYAGVLVAIGLVTAVAVKNEEKIIAKIKSWRK